MSEIKPVNPQEFKAKLPEFEEKTRAFAAGDLSMKDYKGFSGKYGSYAQRGGKAHMLRLRMPAGRLTKDRLNFIIDQVHKHNLNLAHFSTCQTVQLHNLPVEDLFEIMDAALDAGIVWYGGGGDYPRNVMCSPLSGTDPDEYFDVMPYAQAASDFMIQFIDEEKMPRKLKVGFSSSKKNQPHATFRDLGFAAREDGKFDVYCAGGLGSNPKFGVLVEEGLDPKDVCYAIEAMMNLFKKHGNYQNRTKARTRYMQDTLGVEGLKEAFKEELAAVRASQSITLSDLPSTETSKKGNGSTAELSFRVMPQKQDGLYTVVWHPLGGSPDLEELENLSNVIEDMEDVEIRLAPDETAYIINLNGDEVKKVLEVTDKDAAKNPFETSISCIGASICQVGVRDSQDLLKKSLQAVREAQIADNALPQIHISGCPSSCGTHQVGSIGFRGGVKVVDKKPVPAFILFADGQDEQGEEKMGIELGAIAAEQIPAFLVELGKTVQQSNLDYQTWNRENPGKLAEIAAAYILQ